MVLVVGMRDGAGVGAGIEVCGDWLIERDTEKCVVVGGKRREGWACVEWSDVGFEIFLHMLVVMIGRGNCEGVCWGR